MLSEKKKTQSLGKKLVISATPAGNTRDSPKGAIGRLWSTVFPRPSGGGAFTAGAEATSGPSLGSRLDAREAGRSVSRGAEPLPWQAVQQVAAQNAHGSVTNQRSRGTASVASQPALTQSAGRQGITRKCESSSGQDKLI